MVMETSYKSIDDVLLHNKQLAISRLKEMGGEKTFCKGIDDVHGDEPYVLMDLGGGDIEDCLVKAVRLTDVDTLEMYLPILEFWFPLDWALGATENNVYELI